MQGNNLRDPARGTFCRITSWLYSTGTWEAERAKGRCTESSSKASKRQQSSVMCGPELDPTLNTLTLKIIKG